MKMRKRALSFLLMLLIIFGSIYAVPGKVAEAANSTVSGTITNSATQSALTVITCPSISRVVSVSTNTGSVSYSIAGNYVTVNCSGGAATAGASAAATATLGPQASSTFAASMPYSAGGKTGTLYKSGAAIETKGAAKSVPGTYTTGWVRPYPNPFPATHFYQGSSYSGNIPKDGPFQKKGAGTTANPYYWLQNYSGTVYLDSTWKQNYSGTIYAPSTYSYSITIIYETAAVTSSVALSASYQAFNVNTTTGWHAGEVKFDSKTATSSFSLDRVAVGQNPSTTGNNPPASSLQPTSFTASCVTTLAAGTAYTLKATNGISGAAIATANWTSASNSAESHSITVPITTITATSGSVPITLTVSAPSVGLSDSFTASVAWRKINTTVAAQWEKVGFYVSSIDGQSISKTLINAPNGVPNDGELFTLINNNSGNATIAGRLTHDVYGAWRIHCINGDSIASAYYDLTGYPNDPQNINLFTGWQTGTRTTFTALANATISYTGIIFANLTETYQNTSGTTITGYGGVKRAGFDPATSYTYGFSPSSIPSYTFQSGQVTDMNGARTFFTTSPQTAVFNQINTTANVVYTLQLIGIPTPTITATPTPPSATPTLTPSPTPTPAPTVSPTPTLTPTPTPIISNIKLKNFRVTMIKDKDLETFYKNPAGNPKYIDKPLNVNFMGLDKSTFIGAAGVTESFKSLTKGYTFRFKIDSEGANGSTAKVEITPSFYTINTSGQRSINPVDIYWKDSNNEFWKAGEGGHSSWFKLVLLDKDREKIDSDKGTWSGEYLLPGSSFAVAKGGDILTAKGLFYANSYIKEDIIVCFAIKAYKGSTMEYDYNAAGWPVERITIKSPYKIGEVIRYDWQLNNLFRIKTRRIF